MNARKLGSIVGCDADEGNTSQDLLNCLRNVPAKELISHDREFFVSFMTDFVPTYMNIILNEFLLRLKPDY